MCRIPPLSTKVRYSLFFLAVLSTATIFAGEAYGCQYPPFYNGLGYPYTWAHGASVSVNIDPTFTTSERSSVTGAFTTFQGTVGGIWGVTFSFTYSSTPISGTNTFQVTHTTPTCPGGVGTCRASTGGSTNGFRRTSALTKIDQGITDTTAMKIAMLHELGHSFGLDDCVNCQFVSDTIMVGYPSVNDTNGLQSLTACDVVIVNLLYVAPGCPASTQPIAVGVCPAGSSPDPSGSAYCCEDGYCNGIESFTSFPSTGCASGFSNHGGFCEKSYTFQGQCAGPSYYEPSSCSCPDGWEPSPIVIDVDGGGFHLTNASDGVNFNIFADGSNPQISWTAEGSTNAFLVLDRDGNGTIDSGEELFGNFTPQPESINVNGFLALAEYDKPENGGTGNGKINQNDAIFSQLRLWQDANHNGVSEPSELHTLPALGLKTINLDYKQSRRTDEHGNRFRYRAKVRDAQDAQLGRWAWDVYFVMAP